MRIALITRRFPPLIGGAEKVLGYLAPALARQGADVHVLTANPPGLDLPARETVAASPGSLVIERLPTSRTRFLGTFLYMISLSKHLQFHDYDIAYVSMMKHDAHVAVGAGRRRGFPVVLRPEGAGATGDVAWQKWGRFGQRIARRCRRADAIVAIAEAVARELREDGYDPERIVPLANGVPVPEVPWRPRPGWRAAPRAVFVGRLAREKGLDTLVDAWEVVRRAHRHAQLTLVGEGPERPALGSRVAHLGLDDAITFAGPRADPTEDLRGADLFVLPSREEGMSVALLEAMALGMPVVASSVAGNRRLVADGRNGRTAPPDHPLALAESILEQWGNFDRAIRMGEAARALVRERFSIETMAREHLDLFRALVSQERARVEPE